MHQRLFPFSGTNTPIRSLLKLVQIFTTLFCLAFSKAGYVQTYLINGLGEYSEFNEAALIVKLELESPATDALGAIAIDSNKQLSIRILKDRTPRAWSRIWIQNLSINNPPDTLKRQTNDLIAMTQAMKGRLMVGDVVEFERVANDLTLMRVNGVELADFTTAGFFEFLLSAFIGSIPPSGELKLALLAGGNYSAETSLLFDSLTYTEDRSEQVAGWIAPPPAPEPEPEPIATSVEVAEEAVPEKAAEQTKEVVEQTAQKEVAKAITEKAVEDIPEEVTEEETPIVITAESLLAAQNYQRTTLSKIYQNLSYPSSAQRRNREGSLRVVISIGNNGQLVDAEVVQNAQFSVFDKAALKAVSAAAPFDPLPAGTIEVPMMLEIPVAFRLQ